MRDRLSPGLGTYLQKWGYHTAFFHGGQNGTMFLDSYAQIAGFSEYYGLREYPFPSGIMTARGEYGMSRFCSLPLKR